MSRTKGHGKSDPSQVFWMPVSVNKTKKQKKKLAALLGLDLGLTVNALACRRWHHCSLDPCVCCHLRVPRACPYH